MIIDNEEDIKQIYQDNQDPRFMLYNKIVDPIIYLGSNGVIRMNLTLYSNSEKYGRRYYYSEVGYTSSNGYESVKISRDFDSYLSIENLKPINGKKAFIIIRSGDLERMRLFVGPKLEYWAIHSNELFEVRSNGKLYRKTPPKIPSLPKIKASDSEEEKKKKRKEIDRINKEYGPKYEEWNNKYAPIEIEANQAGDIIGFRPGIQILMGDNPVSCVDMYLGDRSTSNIIQIRWNKVLEFTRIMRLFDMNQYANTMISYLGRPEIGTNLFKMNPNSTVKRDNSPFNIPGKNSVRNNLGYFARLEKEKKK